MFDITKLTSNSLTNPSPNLKSFSGKEILDNLVLIANQADKKINPELLSQFYHPFDGVYLEYIQKIVSSLNLNERPLYHPHQPIGQYNKQHHDLKKNILLQHIPLIKHFDSTTFNQLSSNDSLLLVSYHLWYNFNDSSNYFDDHPIPAIIADHKGIPKTLKQKVSNLYEHYLKSKGLRKSSEVEQEILTILTPNRLTTYPLEILVSTPSDLFQYNHRLFSLRHKTKLKDNNLVAYNNHWDGDWIDLIWSLGIYTNTTKLIGYIPFNQEINKTKKLFLQ